MRMTSSAPPTIISQLTKEARGGAALLGGCPLAFCVKRPEQGAGSRAAGTHILQASRAEVTACCGMELLKPPVWRCELDLAAVCRTACVGE